MVLGAPASGVESVGCVERAVRQGVEIRTVRQGLHEVEMPAVGQPADLRGPCRVRAGHLRGRVGRGGRAGEGAGGRERARHEGEQGSGHGGPPAAGRGVQGWMPRWVATRARGPATGLAAGRVAGSPCRESPGGVRPGMASRGPRRWRILAGIPRKPPDGWPAHPGRAGVHRDRRPAPGPVPRPSRGRRACCPAAALGGSTSVRLAACRPRPAIQRSRATEPWITNDRLDLDADAPHVKSGPPARCPVGHDARMSARGRPLVAPPRFRPGSAHGSRLHHGASGPATALQEER